MGIRARSLPSGWYPTSGKACGAILADWEGLDARAVGEAGAYAAIAPHAGWHYSGRLAWRSWKALGDADAVLIVGGHLSAGAGFRYYAEDGFETPFGPVAADPALSAYLARAVGAVADRSQDNTVEVQLPMSAARYRGAPVACFRAPNDAGAAALGLAAARYASERGLRLRLLGSTDLTHYGEPYGFQPAGPAPDGFAWARRADSAIIDAFVSLDEPAALDLAGRQRSACSVGAAIAAIAFARAMGAGRAELLGSGSSDELSPGSDASVGYCSVAYLPA